ncbi:uncharacterized protein FSUBG_342 [Fusarium subglutinans]|uniref:Uncharacterized protein n=1 Tax=Gibberella subglutinans TaxID=42677 RepID=A0A8H5V9G2_GIBSU|nr:uncharacterized protein FSUBG_342 [Fusarium subglutinans]KAF5613730.1 hypothetical protein FSUBG_342 [Fusarium subglutinans]
MLLYKIIINNVSGHNHTYDISWPGGAGQLDVDDDEIEQFSETLNVATVPFQVSVNPTGNPHVGFSLSINTPIGTTANVKHKADGTMTVTHPTN